LKLLSILPEQDVTAFYVTREGGEGLVQGCPRDIVQRMQQNKAVFAVIGKDQVTSDIPGFKYMMWDIGPGCACPRLPKLWHSVWNCFSCWALS
jgi:hypothetical protein